MTLTPDVNRQYLHAMGIESWELRAGDSDIDVISQQPASVAAAKPLAQAGVDGYLQSLAESPVTMTNSVQNSILVLLEAPVLSVPGAELLTSMFKAINVDLSLQSLGYLAEVDNPASQSVAPASTLSAVAGAIQPAMIMVMINLQTDIDALAAHRASLHSVGWASAPVAITLHPHELLEDPANKRHAWEDLKQVKAALNG